jgi:hypothetical protein
MRAWRLGGKGVTLPAGTDPLNPKAANALAGPIEAARHLHFCTLLLTLEMKEKPMRVLGTLLVLFGVILIVLGGITLFVPRDVIDLGALSIHVNENLVIPMPPIVGLICVLLGFVMIAATPPRRWGP